jgi:16S rRNA (adenine1518-N6/adenine1519-N6)-dimethyltransferase
MVRLLTPTDVRFLAERLGVRPSKRWGQNFVVDAGTVRRVVRTAGVEPGSHVLEVGPGLGSLSLALLEAGVKVTAVEIDPDLASALPETVRDRAPDVADRLAVLTLDAMTVVPDDVRAAWGGEAESGPTAMVANLPYNVAVPVILHVLEAFPGIGRVLVMVQAEVADRIVAAPGSRVYGIPSAKIAWFASARPAGRVSRAAFWPVPRVDSALVLLDRWKPPDTAANREEVFRVVDAAFSQRRKGLRSALAGLAGTPAEAEGALAAAGIGPLARGETLGISEFASLAERLFPGRGASGTVKG